MKTRMSCCKLFFNFGCPLALSLTAEAPAEQHYSPRNKAQSQASERVLRPTPRLKQGGISVHLLHSMHCCLTYFIFVASRLFFWEARENQFCFCFTLRKLTSKWQLTTRKENASEDLGQVDRERGLSCSKHLIDVSIMVTVSVVTNKYGKLAINGGMFVLLHLIGMNVEVYAYYGKK